MNDPIGKQWMLGDLRKSAGLTQGELARRMGVNRPRVGQIERDFPNVRFNVVEAYIRALDGDVKFAASGLEISTSAVVKDPRERRDHGQKYGTVKWIPAAKKNAEPDEGADD